MLKNLRSIYPIPKDWEKDEDRRKFSTRLDEMIRELFSRVTAAERWFSDIKSGTNLNNLTTPGLYGCNNSTTAGTLINCPVSSGFSLLVSGRSNTYQTQTIFYGSAIYCRTKTSGGWGNWYVFTGTAV